MEKFFKNFAEALIESDRVKREADNVSDGHAVLTYMKVYTEQDMPHRRVAKYFCRVFGNALKSNYQHFMTTKKVSDLFPSAKNQEEMKEALNFGRRYLKEAGWVLRFLEDHIEWSFENRFRFTSPKMLG